MKAHLLKRGGRLTFTTEYGMPSRIREVRVMCEEPREVVIEKVQVGKEGILLGSLVVSHLTQSPRGGRSLFLSSGVPKDAPIVVWLRSLGGSQIGQTISADIRLQAADGIEVVLTLEDAK